jgi:hypothetical protein
MAGIRISHCFEVASDVAKASNQEVGTGYALLPLSRITLQQCFPLLDRSGQKRQGIEALEFTAGGRIEASVLQRVRDKKQAHKQS